MKLRDMPKESTRRLSILCLDGNSIDLLDDTPEGKQVLSKKYEGLYILDVNQHSNLSEYGFIVADNYRLSKGTILVLSPYDSHVYAEIGNARDIFSIQKADYFFEFCQKVGASFIELSEIKVQLSEDMIKFMTDGNHPIGEVRAEFERKKKEQLSYELTRTMKLADSKPNLTAAKTLLINNNLMADSIFRQLYNMRSHELEENGSPIKEYEQKINLVKTHEQSLDFVLNINFPQFACSGGYSRACKEIYECESSIKVIF